MTDTTDDTETRMTRRDAIKGGSAAAVAAGSYLLQQQLVQRAAAQTSEPRIQLGSDWVLDDDPDGNGYFAIEHTPNGNRYVFQDDGRVTAFAATLEEAEVTNETGVFAERDSQSPTITDTTNWTNIVDTELSDTRDEFNENGNYQFVPDKNGEYIITGSCNITDLSNGDRGQIRVYDADNDQQLGKFREMVAVNVAVNVGFTFVKQLTAGTAYEIQGCCPDNDYIINNFGTEFTIYRKVA